MRVEVSESGGARWSPSPGGSLPGDPDATLSVVVHPDPGARSTWTGSTPSSAR